MFILLILLFFFHFSQCSFLLSFSYLFFLSFLLFRFPYSFSLFSLFDFRLFNLWPEDGFADLSFFVSSSLFLWCSSSKSLFSFQWFWNSLSSVSLCSLFLSLITSPVYSSDLLVGVLYPFYSQCLYSPFALCFILSLSWFELFCFKLIVCMVQHF